MDYDVAGRINIYYPQTTSKSCGIIATSWVPLLFVTYLFSLFSRIGSANLECPWWYATLLQNTHSTYLVASTWRCSHEKPNICQERKSSSCNAYYHCQLSQQMLLSHQQTPVLTTFQNNGFLPLNSVQKNHGIATDIQRKITRFQVDSSF